MTHVHIVPAPEHRRDFARWCLAQNPRIETASANGSDVPIDLYPSVPVELLEGAYVDGFQHGGSGSPQPVAGVPEAPATPPEGQIDDVQGGALGDVASKTPTRRRKGVDRAES